MPRIIKPKTRKYTLKDESGHIYHKLSRDVVTYDNMKSDRDYSHLLTDKKRFDSIGINYLDNKKSMDMHLLMTNVSRLKNYDWKKFFPKK